MAGRLARWLVRRLWLGAQARVVFQRPCARPEVPAVLAAAAVDLAGRLHGQALQDRTLDGKPEVKSDVPGHLCWHRWRLRRGGLTATLTLFQNTRIGGRALPYVWVQGSPHLAWCIARLFRPL